MLTSNIFSVTQSILSSIMLRVFILYLGTVATVPLLLLRDVSLGVTPLFICVLLM